MTGANEVEPRSGAPDAAPAVIAWVGGCHLAGYRVGPEAGFVDGVGRLLAAGGTPVRNAVLQPVPSHHVERMLRFAADAGPALTVLQLGNFETGLTLGSLARRALGRRGTKAAAPPVAPDDPATRYVPGTRAHARVLAKRLAHLVLGRQVRHRAVARQVADAADAIAAATGAPVLVLAPMPCVDPVVDGHRRRLEGLLAGLLPSGAFLALDRDAVRASGPCAYADPIHLGADGHRVAAASIASWVRASGVLGAGATASDATTRAGTTQM